jgi:hypothetical protein
MSQAKPAAIFITLAIMALSSVGCTRYTTPGPGADLARLTGMTEEQMRAGTDAGIQQMLDRRPMSPMPATLAVARVQGSGYRSVSVRHAHGRGTYSVVTTRDIEREGDYQRVAALPMVADLVTISRLFLPTQLEDHEQLREAAAAAHADMLLIYTLDTALGLKDLLEPASVLTLGMFPSKQAQVSSSAAAVLLDTRTGFLYGAVEATEHRRQAANAWTSASAIDDARKAAERAAFEKMLDEFELLWADVVRRRLPQGADVKVLEDRIKAGRMPTD